MDGQHLCHWCDPTNATAWKVVIAPDGRLIPRNYYKDDLHKGDIALTMRIDGNPLKKNKETPSQRAIAIEMARILYKEMLHRLGVTVEHEFEEGQLLEIRSNTPQNPSVQYGIVVKDHGEFITILTHNGSRLSKKRISIVNYDLMKISPRDEKMFSTDLLKKLCFIGTKIVLID